jgi:cardiolipin synthase A/B
MTVDGVWSIVGTANFDNRSLELNDELIVAVQDPRLATTLRTAFDADQTRSQVLDLEGWRGRPLWHRVHERFWSLFGELF